MEIGAIIKKARQEKGITQETAADALGVSRQTISNWETGRTYPDILSVIRMSDLYAVSLDRLLKEEDSVNQTYRDYLEESTNTVRSNERRSQLTLILVTLGVWALSVIAFWLVHSGMDAVGYSLSVTWVVLPVLFFAASFIIGWRNWFGRWKWLTALVFGLMYALTGYASSITVDQIQVKSVIWPDFSKLPIGLLLSLAGLGLGIWLARRQQAAIRQGQVD
ncbi:MAG: helix-turn-helix transcriptional regulator [Clostridiales bacterium]|nr:helix-turn-helix transcriptional regulator [Clostridiales bacterium]